MGFYFRKSVRFGPFRVNFSKSGVGFSAGIPGLRIGTGPHGNYIQAGAHGFYYRSSLPHADQLPQPRRAVAARPHYPQYSQHPRLPVEDAAADPTLGRFVPIESADAAQMVDSSSEALLEQIRSRNARRRRWPIVAILSGLAIAGAAYGANELHERLLADQHWEVLQLLPLWVAIPVALAGIVLCLLAFRSDVRRKLVILQYELNSVTTDAFSQLVDGGAALKGCHGAWQLNSQAQVLDRKYHAGACAEVTRSNLGFQMRPPSYLVSNVEPFVIVLGRLVLYFFPDRMLVYQGDQVGALAYATLQVSDTLTRFIENHGAPGDTQIVGRTWKYVNKKGGPDRRFSNNPELPICQYSELALKSSTGLNVVLQLSNPNGASRFATALKSMARVARIAPECAESASKKESA